MENEYLIQILYCKGGVIHREVLEITEEEYKENEHLYLQFPKHYSIDGIRSDAGDYIRIWVHKK